MVNPGGITFSFGAHRKVVEHTNQAAIDPQRSEAQEESPEAPIALLEKHLAHSDATLRSLNKYLENRVAQSEMSISSLKTNLQVRVAQNECTTANLKANLEQRVAQKERTITNLETNLKLCVAQNEREIANLKENLEQRVAQSEVRIANLKTKEHAQDIAIQTLNEKITVLQTGQEILQDKERKRTETNLKQEMWNWDVDTNLALVNAKVEQINARLRANQYS